MLRPPATGARGSLLRCSPLARPLSGVATAAVAPVTGVADDGTPFTGTFTLDKFREHKGVLRRRRPARRPAGC